MDGFGPGDRRSWRGDQETRSRIGWLGPGRLPSALALLAAIFPAGAQAAACPAAGAPTPVDLTVTSLPITVSSTTADYFVLYLKHDLGGGDMRELPVSVTEGRDGATKLTWSLAADTYPASRYRVEKYEVANPADVDCDGIDDLTELNGDRTTEPPTPPNNPVNPARQLDVASEGLNRLDAESEWREIVHDAPWTRAVKLTLHDLDADRPYVYFQNANHHPSHPGFAKFLGKSYRDTVSVEINRGTFTLNGVEESFYYWWFPAAVREFPHSVELPWIHTALAASMEILSSGSRLAFYFKEASELLISRERIAKYRELGVPIFYDRDVKPNVTISGGGAVTEGADAEFTVSVAPPPLWDMNVKLLVGNAGSSDFVAPKDTGSKSVEIAAGAATATVRVATVDDRVDEANGFVDGSLQRLFGTSYWVGAPERAQVAVLDNDLPEAAFSSGFASVGEAGGAHDVMVSIGPSPATPIGITYSISGTATRGSDYTIGGLTGNSRTLHVAAGATSATIAVAVADDNVTEGDETVVLTLEEGTGYAVAGPNAHTLAINDDDAPDIAVGPLSLTVNEGGQAKSYTLRLATDPGGTAAVTPSLSLAGKVTVSPKVLMFGSGDWRSAKAVTVTPLNDGNADDEQVVISHAVSGYGSLTKASDVVVVVDDDEVPETPGVDANPLSVHLHEGGQAKTYMLSVFQ